MPTDKTELTVTATTLAAIDTEVGRVVPVQVSIADAEGTVLATLEERFAGRGYGDLKKETADVLVEWVTPFRDRANELLEDPAELDRILAAGAERAREVASATLGRVYDAVGLLRPAGHR